MVVVVRDTAARDAALGRVADRSARVVVIGQGYVGLPVAMRAVQVGFSTLGFDVDEMCL